MYPGFGGSLSRRNGIKNPLGDTPDKAGTRYAADVASKFQNFSSIHLSEPETPYWHTVMIGQPWFDPIASFFARLTVTCPALEHAVDSFRVHAPATKLYRPHTPFTSKVAIDLHVRATTTVALSITCFHVRLLWKFGLRRLTFLYQRWGYSVPFPFTWICRPVHDYCKCGFHSHQSLFHPRHVFV